MKRFICLTILLLFVASHANAIERNVAGKLEVTAIDRTTGGPKTGDADQITVYYAIDGGAVTALTDTTATEKSSTNAPGIYQFDLAQAETNGKDITYSGKSATADVDIIPRYVTTTPPNHSLTAVDSSGRTSTNVTQVAGSTGAATNLSDFGTQGYDPTNNYSYAGVVLTGAGAITQASFAAGAIDAAALNADAGTEIGAAVLAVLNADSAYVDLLSDADSLNDVKLTTNRATALDRLPDNKPAVDSSGNSAADLVEVNTYATIDGYKPAQLLAIIASMAGGNITDSEDSTPKLRSLDNDLNRISSTVDQDGNRTNTINVTDIP